MKTTGILLTCEHGGNEVPEVYKKYFRDFNDVLSTHRGFDIGALGTAEIISKLIGAPLIGSEVSRLLIDLNRSPGSKNLFSKASRQLSSQEKAKILEKYYFTHHFKVQTHLRESLKKSQRILHIAVHSFTPVWQGSTRNADVGILYDPKSNFEFQFASKLRIYLKSAAPQIRIRMNYPYKGTSDGLTKILRASLGNKKYAGIEIEINQSFFEQNIAVNQKRIAEQFARAIVEAKDALQ